MTNIKPKLAISMFGAAAVKAAPEGVTQMLVGVIGGVASGIFLAKAQDGVTDVPGLRGDFFAQIIRTGEGGKQTIEAFQSGKCYLHDALQPAIENLLQGKIKTDENGAAIVGENGKPVYEVPPAPSVEFAFKVYGVKASNKAGFTYGFEPVKEVGVNDPLAAQKAEALAALGFAADGQKAIAAPETAPAPDKKTK